MIVVGEVTARGENRPFSRINEGITVPFDSYDEKLNLWLSDRDMDIIAVNAIVPNLLQSPNISPVFIDAAADDNTAPPSHQVEAVYTLALNDTVDTIVTMDNSVYMPEEYFEGTAFHAIRSEGKWKLKKAEKTAGDREQFSWLTQELACSALGKSSEAYLRAQRQNTREKLEKRGVPVGSMYTG